MRHFSLFDDMGDGFKKKTADDNFFTIDLGNEGALLGLMDVLTWARDNTEENVEKLAEYLNDLYSAEDYILRINASQFAQIRNAFYNFMNYIEQFPSRDEFEAMYPDFEIEDIWDAEEALMMASSMESSSGKGLEDIPTMEKNPEDLAPGETPTVSNETCPKCHAVNTFSTVDEFGEIRCDNCGYADPARNPKPQAQPEDEGFENCPMCGVNGVDPTYQECENCGWDQTNACPDCFNDRSITVDEFGSKRCNNCGWSEEPEHPVPGSDAPGVLPPLSDAAKKIKSLEDAFAAPSVEHPLGPHTGAEEGGQELYTSGRFVNLAKWPSNPVWGVEVAPAAGQRDPMPGDLATIQQKSKAFNRPVPVTLVEDMGGAWTFKNGHHPA